MSCLPSPAGRRSQLGIRQIEEEYQQRHSSRARWTRVCGGALLLAFVTHAVLLTAFIRSVVEQASLFPVERVVPYLGGNLCMLPFTWLLARLYLRNRAAAGQAWARLNEIQSLRQRKVRRPPPG